MSFTDSGNTGEEIVVYISPREWGWGCGEELGGQIMTSLVLNLLKLKLLRDVHAEMLNRKLELKRRVQYLGNT